MIPKRWLTFIAPLCLGACLATSAAAAGYRHFDWQQVAPGVWFGRTKPDSFQTGNSTIVALPGGGSLVVDSQDAQFLAREIIEEAKQVAPGPVKYLVNTHLHQDHLGGNAAFRKEYPHVQIIAHSSTCTALREKTIPRMKARLPAQQKALEQMQAKRAALSGDDRDAAALDRKIAGLQLYLQEARNFEWEPPDTCLNLKPGQEKVIDEGGRRIEIGYFGRAHSTGDLVVFLPNEKVAIVGDLWAEHTGQMLFDAGLDGRDGSVLEGPLTQRAVRKLDFDLALPGHSAPMRGKAALDAAIANGDQMVAKIRASAQDGDNVEEALRKIPAPAGANAFITDRWHRVIIRGFEELELRRQLGLPLRAADASQ